MWKKGWKKGEDGWEKGGEEWEKGEDYPCPPPRISKKNRQHKEKVQKDKHHIYVLGI